MRGGVRIPWLPLTVVVLYDGTVRVAAQTLLSPDTTLPAGTITGSVVAAETGLPLEDAVVVIEPLPAGALPAARQGARVLASGPGGVGEVSFTPDWDVLVVRIATRQAAGSLVLETSAAPTASATVRGQGEHEAVVVLPDELRIANTAESRATYWITLPAQLKRVIVVIDGDRALTLTPVAPGEAMTSLAKLIPLAVVIGPAKRRRSPRRSGRCCAIGRPPPVLLGRVHAERRGMI